MANINKYQIPSGNTFLSHRDEFITSFDRLFNQVFETVFPESSKELGVDLFSKGSYPKVNVIEENDKVTIEAEIPGLLKDQVGVEIKESILTIKGNKKTNDNSEKKGVYVFRELKQSSFERSFQLNDNLDVDKMKAKFENGILLLTIPKKVPFNKVEQTKVIQIE